MPLYILLRCYFNEDKQENDEKVRVKNELKSNSKINEKAKNKEQKNLKIKPEKRKI